MTDIALPVGWTLAAFDAVDSTNDEAIKRAEDGAAEGAIVWSRQQLAGRGRRGRDWQSPLGNMYASIVVRPDCPPDQAAQLGFVTAIAVGETASGLLPASSSSASNRVTYKWPNDVQVDGAKIAGILLESAPGADGKVAYVVIGTGINVEWKPGETAYPVASLTSLGAKASVDRVLEAYCRNLAKWLGIWRRDGFAVIRSTWLARAGNLGQIIDVKAGQESCRGRFSQLDEHGAIILEIEGGTTRRITAGEIFPVAA
ncbi:MAG: biotin--[acetyl-CoA-carboxylase] ligase [Rhodospirillales bacterium]